LKRLTRVFTDIRRGEGITVILLMLDLFILLTAYLIIKTVREPLILISGGAEVKSYAAAGHVLLLLLIIPIFLAKVRRRFIPLKFLMRIRTIMQPASDAPLERLS
jgi:ATP/ADP translocase